LGEVADFDGDVIDHYVFGKGCRAPMMGCCTNLAIEATSGEDARRRTVETFLTLYAIPATFSETAHFLYHRIRVLVPALRWWYWAGVLPL
ncbi:hypothetical protein, partial [Mesorhizobium sp. M2A.F.Ca.ET.067.02.1.1]|uniref:hypothetical protein n=1 Tax=Mesorhizobium sp. M2A.F.Ca.ET.067.02.1.1 TaxID=2496749 RepID=UPI001AECE5F7